MSFAFSRCFLAVGTVVLAVVSHAAAATAVAPISETLEGQVTCSNCWFEADRTKVIYGSEGDLACARRCAEVDVPPALAVHGPEGFELFLLTDKPPEGGAWLNWIGKFVRVEGTASADDGKKRRALVVTSIDELDGNPWASAMQQAPALGADEIVWTDALDRPVSLADLAGGLTVVNFWATWCKPCIREMPDLVRVRKQFAAYGVTFIGAAADASEHKEAVLDFARRRGVDFRIVLGATTVQMESLGLAPVLPGTVLLDAKGDVLERFPGVVDPDRLSAAIADALGLDRSSAAAGAGRIARAPAKAAHATHASLVPS